MQDNQQNPAMSPAMSPAYPPHSQGYNGGYPANASTLDDLISGGAREVDDIDEIIRMAEAGIKIPKRGESQPAQTAAPIETTLPETAAVAVTTPAPETTEKKSKKEKGMRMIYSDNEMSPEEKMAKMPRYAFVPEGKVDTILVDANDQPGVAGVVDEDL